MKSVSKDFKCSCGCGQRIRIIFLTHKNGKVIDISILQPKQRRNKFGIVLRSDEKNSLNEFLNFIQKGL